MGPSPALTRRWLGGGGIPGLIGEAAPGGGGGRCGAAATEPLSKDLRPVLSAPALVLLEVLVRLRRPKPSFCDRGSLPGGRDVGQALRQLLRRRESKAHELNPGTERGRVVACLHDAGSVEAGAPASD